MQFHGEFILQTIVISTGNDFTTLLSLETKALFQIQINDGMH